VGAEAYGTPSPNLFNSVPAIEITGGALETSGTGLFQNVQKIYFNPKSPKTAELIDSDGDGVIDDPINDYTNFVNAANRMYDADIAQCYGNNSGSLIWNQAYQPDTIPETAVRGTQYIKITMPFDIDPSSLFELSPLITGFDYLSGSITIIDEDNEHVKCTVLLNGKDAIYYRDPENRPAGHTADDHDYTGLFSAAAQAELIAPNIILFVAQTEVDQAALRKSANPVFRENNRRITAFTALTNFPNQWLSSKNEIRIRIDQIKDILGNRVNVNARYYAAKTNFDSTQVLPNLASTDITAVDILGVDTTTINPATGVPFSFPNNQIISRSTNFLLTFNKPVIPETVARSLIFDRPPFNGNTQVVPNRLVTETQLPAPCQGGGGPPPLATNISLIAQYIDENGTSQTQSVIPFRCYPIHQNNLATYVIDPLIDLPGSTPVGTDTENPLTMRIEVNVYPSGSNTASGDPDDAGALNPVNLGPSSFFGETYTGGGNVIRRRFSVEPGGRYVNAPVSPQALYYSMGPKGVGVIDLDGNGFTTNHPEFSKPALVTSLRFYSFAGSAAMGTGNSYAYGAKANPGSYVRLGSETSVPGVNEGSGDKDHPGLGGMDSVVRDSNGNAQLYPDASLSESFLKVNITDIELGDFLDTVFYDKDNRWAKNSFHVSFASSGLFVGKYKNNIIDTPPTPNPPPLTLPVGMRVVDVVIDDTGFLDEGAMVIMGKEVFSFGIQNDPSFSGGNSLPFDTTFIHLEPAASAGTEADRPYPPNPFMMFQNYLTDFVNSGPLAESSTIGTGFYYGSRQQIGNFLFAADKSNNDIKVLNSNSMDLITTLTGFSAPDSVAVSPDLQTMYVSNSGSGFLSVFNVDPRTDGFLSHIADVAVGVQPKGICVQPDYDDVLVCNYGSNSVSIVNPSDNTVRKTVSSLVNRPWDLVAGPRQANFGFQTQVYHAYISNYGSNNVLIFESGPSGLGGVGYDDILDPVPLQGSGGQTFLPIESPRGICWDPHFVLGNSLSGGCFVAHSSGSYSLVSRIQFTKQQAPVGPILIVTPRGLPGGTPGFGKRVFEITAQWGGPDNPLSGGAGGATDVALMDYNRDLWLNNNWTGDPYVTNYGGLDNNPKIGMPINDKHPVRIITVFGLGQYSPVAYSDRLFVSFENGRVGVLDLFPPEAVEVLQVAGNPNVLGDDENGAVYVFVSE
ncbi:MAG: YncE family protein, partial [Planctomycetes bacterium]|nr:YncE family protein [Planctomycetota bacterium]